MEVCLETRQDLIELLKTSPYDFIILKFKADWCRPCKVIEPFVHDLVDKKIAQLDKENKKDVFLYVEVDVDVCFDLYAFLRQKKRINGIPAMFLYCKTLYKQQDPEYQYIPQSSVTGANESGIKKLFELIQWIINLVYL